MLTANFIGQFITVKEAKNEELALCSHTEAENPMPESAGTIFTCPDFCFNANPCCYLATKPLNA